MNKIKYFLIPFLFFIALFINTNSSYAEIIRSTLEVAKMRNPDNTYHYEAWVEAVGPSIRSVLKGKLRTPFHKKFLLNKIDNFEMRRDLFFDSYDDLLINFPEGKYILSLRGKTRADLLFYFDKPEFPPDPEILSLQDYETGVELTPTISWLDVGYGSYSVTIWKQSTGDEILFERWDDQIVTSFTVPDNLLEYDTWYQVEVCAVNMENTNGHTFYCLQFKTCSE